MAVLLVFLAPPVCISAFVLSSRSNSRIHCSPRAPCSLSCLLSTGVRLLVLG